ncbi:MAG: gliding motility-associated C-terminal domain-containing protein, partial [Bacteroidota bacterium]
VDFRVYDRWGGEVYVLAENDFGILQGWDGTHRGEPSPVGTYVYLGRVELLDGTIREITGTVNLLR